MSFLASASKSVAAASSDQALETIRRQYTELMLEIPSRIRQAKGEDYAQRLLASQREDGTWPTVDYADQTRGGWKTCNHLRYALILAKAYRTKESPLCGDPKVKTAIVRAVDHWIANDYICPNWWYNKIGVPMVLSDTVLLMQDQLSEEAVTRTLKIIERAKFGMTGQNSVWLAGITFTRALIIGDRELALRAREIILKDLIVTSAEGLQSDMSFHQHGPQLQFGNYGLSFASDMCRWARAWRGTDFALTDEQFSLLRRYMLEGERWAVYRERMDISSCGRQIFPDEQKRKASVVARVCREMGDMDDPRYSDAYTRIIEHTHKGEPVKYFPRSDYMTQNGERFMMSVHMSSRRTIGSETCNSENMLGLLLGDGAMFVYLEGDEYANIFPAWDWYRLPGITCHRGYPASLVPGRVRNDSEFVGGLTYGNVAGEPADVGTCGICAMEYKRFGVTAYKSWFFTGQAVVCLGAGITSKQDAPLGTTINQCLLDGPVTYRTVEGEAEVFPASTDRVIEGVRSISHDGVTYIMVEPTNLRVATKERTGTWRSIRHAMSGEPVTQPVFLAEIDHGTRPESAGYAYIVFPAPVTAPGSVGLLSNTSAAQAMYDSQAEIFYAVFYEPAAVIGPDDCSVSVDRPCILLIDFKNRCGTVCDPTGKHEEIKIGTGCGAVKVSLKPGRTRPTEFDF